MRGCWRRRARRSWPAATPILRRNGSQFLATWPILPIQDEREEATREDTVAPAGAQRRGARSRTGREQGGPTGIALGGVWCHLGRGGAQGAQRAARYSWHRPRADLFAPRGSRLIAARD